MPYYLTLPRTLRSAGALLILSFLGGCMAMGGPGQASTLPPTAFPPHTGSDSVVQLRVAPDQSFGGPVIRVDGEFDVRMVSSGGVYHVLVQPRSQYAGGAVNILVGGLDNVQVEINRLPPPGAPAVKPTPVKPAPAAPGRAFTPDPDAPGPLLPPSNAHAQARQRLRQDIDKSSPW